MNKTFTNQSLIISPKARQEDAETQEQSRHDDDHLTALNNRVNKVFSIFRIHERYLKYQVPISSLSVLLGLSTALQFPVCPITQIILNITLSDWNLELNDII